MPYEGTLFANEAQELGRCIALALAPGPFVHSFGGSRESRAPDLVLQLLADYPDHFGKCVFLTSSFLGVRAQALSTLLKRPAEVNGDRAVCGHITLLGAAQQARCRESCEDSLLWAKDWLGEEAKGARTVISDPAILISGIRDTNSHYEVHRALFSLGAAFEDRITLLGWGFSKPQHAKPPPVFSRLSGSARIVDDSCATLIVTSSFDERNAPRLHWVTGTGQRLVADLKDGPDGVRRLITNIRSFAPDALGDGGDRRGKIEEMLLEEPGLSASPARIRQVTGIKKSVLTLDLEKMLASGVVKASGFTSDRKYTLVLT